MIDLLLNEPLHKKLSLMKPGSISHVSTHNRTRKTSFLKKHRNRWTNLPTKSSCVSFNGPVNDAPLVCFSLHHDAYPYMHNFFLNSPKRDFTTLSPCPGMLEM